MDYRGINKNTKAINFPIPNFDDLLENLNDAKFFIILDLAWAYLQVPLEEESKKYTSFITETQTGTFERAMFGLAGAPKYFAKLMDKVLGIARRKGKAFTFFDDTCIYASSWEELLENLIFVLKLLKDPNLTINIKKSRFGLINVEYLGYVLGEGVIQPTVVLNQL